MADAGVSVNDECVAKFNDLKLKHAARFIIYRMNDDMSQIVVAEEGDKSKTYEDFVKQLPENDCRYAVFDFEFEVEGNPRSKIIFVNWAPDTAKIRSKMVYAASKEAIKKRLVGISTEVQATDSSEVDRSAVLERVTAV